MVCPLSSPSLNMPDSNWWEKKETLQNYRRQCFGQKRGEKKSISPSSECKPHHPNYNFQHRPEDYISQYVLSLRRRTCVKGEESGVLFGKWKSQICQISAGFSPNFDHIVGSEYQSALHVPELRMALMSGIMTPSTGHLSTQSEKLKNRSARVASGQQLCQEFSYSNLFQKCSYF